MEQENRIQLGKQQQIERINEQLQHLPILKVINNPKALSEFQLALTCEKAIDSVSMALIKKANPIVYRASIDILLCGMVDMVKVANKFTEGEIPFLIDAIYSKYWYFTLDEVAYVFKKGITGDFKKPYNKLDIETVLDWFHEYDSKERLYLLEKRDQNKRHEAIKLSEGYTGVSKEFMQGMIKKISQDNNLDADAKKEKDYQAYRLQYLNSKSK